MSTKHHNAHGNEVQHMIHDVKTMSSLELLSTYNIEIWEDGKIYDRTESTTYTSATEWANSTVEGDDLDYDQYFDGDEMNAQEWK